MVRATGKRIVLFAPRVVIYLHLVTLTSNLMISEFGTLSRKSLECTKIQLETLCRPLYRTRNSFLFPRFHINRNSLCKLHWLYVYTVKWENNVFCSFKGKRKKRLLDWRPWRRLRVTRTPLTTSGWTGSKPITVRRSARSKVRDIRRWLSRAPIDGNSCVSVDESDELIWLCVERVSFCSLSFRISSNVKGAYSNEEIL